MKKSDKHRHSFYHEGFKNLIFVHITKNAGTSIRHSMGFNRPSESYQKRKHLTAQMIIDEIGEAAWQNAYKFAFVRNPWARMVSLYQFQKAKNKNPFFHQNDDISFKNWIITKYHDKSNRELLNRKTQTEWLVDNHGQISIDFVGRFENIVHDFNTLKSLFQANWQLKYKNSSKSSSDFYRPWYDAHTSKLVQEYFKEDIENFDYQW